MEKYLRFDDIVIFEGARRDRGQIECGRVDIGRQQCRVVIAVETDQRGFGYAVGCNVAGRAFFYFPNRLQNLGNLKINTAFDFFFISFFFFFFFKQ